MLTEKIYPYEGKTAILATKHGKEQQIAGPFYRLLRMNVIVPDKIDTDSLGTFTGEIPRRGSPSEVVERKARLGMEQSGASMGLANEGSIGPHPACPFFLGDWEYLVFIDDERGIKVQETLLSERVVAGECTVAGFDELGDFLQRTRFPSHGLIVRPNTSLEPTHIIKGITDLELLQASIQSSARSSSDGKARIESDLRAHMNPTRQRVIRRLAIQLAARLSRQCPACGTPGWGRVDVIRGLLCEWCESETELVREEIYGCPACDWRENRTRSDGLLRAPAGQCQYCNP